MVEYDDGKPTLSELKRYSHSIRNYQPEYLLSTPDGATKTELRGLLKRIESKRFYKFLKSTHKMFTPLDKDEKEMWSEGNPLLMDWLSVYSYLEDIRPYWEYSNLSEPEN